MEKDNIGGEKAIIEESTSGEREELLASIQEGQVIKGYVKNFTG